MHIRKFFLLATILCSVCSLNAQRYEQLLETDWKFHKGEANGAEAVTFNDSQWESVCVPHDWAIYGPFDRNNDLQNVAITQNLEKQASVKTGRTGGLPYVGVGWYRTRFDADPDKKTTLVFDGAMSEPSSIFPLVSGSRTLPECPSDYCRKNTCTCMGYTDYHSTRS